ncbi:loricrin-like [Belonocnema kinseyi]|uniref:loricrin-like n=1 Tax=Belonocnema kinseyi TaxID=2817044 RepID=UPI00143D2A29|nr:loricrin-like [Belonocnema kinseyi]
MMLRQRKGWGNCSEQEFGRGGINIGGGGSEFPVQECGGGRFNIGGSGSDFSGQEYGEGGINVAGGKGVGGGGTTIGGSGGGGGGGEGGGCMIIVIGGGGGAEGVGGSRGSIGGRVFVLAMVRNKPKRVPLQILVMGYVHKYELAEVEFTQECGRSRMNIGGGGSDGGGGITICGKCMWWLRM